jgi:hypothetical protein
VLQLNIVASPSADVVLARFEKSTHPKFAQLFEPIPENSPLCRLARDPDEVSTAVVLANTSREAITALRYRWGITDETGRHHPRTVSSDSYMVDVYRAVAEPGSRHLITLSVYLDESMIDHVLAGGGIIQAGTRSTTPAPKIIELTFEIDFVLFADGEIAGSDPDHFAIELQCRKPAAEFVARQIRIAAAEGRDVTPVLTALAEIPALGRLGHPQGDPRVHWIRHYSREYLRAIGRKIGGLDMPEVRLQHLENRPPLPKFYRRAQ